MPSPPPEGPPAPVDGRLPAAALAGLGQRALSLYVHVPFCASRCGYCDFNTYTAAELGAAPGTSQDAYLRAVEQELDLARRVLTDSGGTAGGAPVVQTVFFGGGTPTLLPAGDLAGMLAAIRQRFEIADDAEITTEANPESVDRAYLATLVEGGFTRLSLGMQSASGPVLALLERKHNPGRVAQVVADARAAGFAAISLDLIYGTPGETDDQWRESLDAAIALRPEHLSAYSLTIEEGTRLGARRDRGEVADVDLDEQADRYLAAEELLSAAGYLNYEISNWAVAGQECRHNLAYWRGGDWWGAGPGAHSHVGGVRWWNLRHPRDYADALERGASPAQAREVLTAEERHWERVMLGLRLSEGLAPEELTEAETQRAQGFAAEGLAGLVGGRWRLTPAGRLLADHVIRGVLDD